MIAHASVDLSTGPLDDAAVVRPFPGGRSMVLTVDVVTPIVEQKEGKVEKDDGKKQSKKFTPGLTHLDAVAIKAAIPAVSATSSEVVVNGVISRQGLHRSGKVVGVTGRGGPPGRRERFGLIRSMAAQAVWRHQSR